MGIAPLSDEVLAEAVALRKRHPSTQAAADAAGLPVSTLKSRLDQAKRRGLYSTYEQIHEKPKGQPREPGGKFEVPDGHVVKGYSVLTDPEGRVLQQWVKTREDLSHVDVVEAVREAFKDFEGTAPAIPAPPSPNADLLTLFPLADWHMGLFSWGAETGNNWDLKIAEAVIGQAVDDVFARSPSSGTAIILGGGDLMHADNKDNRTARSGHVLDVDGRYPKVLQATCRLTVRVIDRALERNEKVIVRILPGNHDEHAAIAISYFLLAWYRNEPRVTVDVDPSLFFWFRFGKVMLGATHGHAAKAKDMPQIMAHRRAEDWGATRYRYIHTFHLHHTRETKTEGGGCVAEVHQTPAPQDAWHFGEGFLSGRSVQTITYHKEYGEISRSRVAIIDGLQQNKPVMEYA